MLCIHRHSQEFISIRVKYSVDDLCSLKVICCTINDGFDLVVNGVWCLLMWLYCSIFFS